MCTGVACKLLGTGAASSFLGTTLTLSILKTVGLTLSRAVSDSLPGAAPPRASADLAGWMVLVGHIRFVSLLAMLDVPELPDSFFATTSDSSWAALQYPTFAAHFDGASTFRDGTEEVVLNTAFPPARGRRLHEVGSGDSGSGDSPPPPTPLYLQSPPPPLLSSPPPPPTGVGSGAARYVLALPATAQGLFCSTLFAHAFLLFLGYGSYRGLKLGLWAAEIEGAVPLITNFAMAQGPAMYESTMIVCVCALVLYTPAWVKAFALAWLLLSTGFLARRFARLRRMLASGEIYFERERSQEATLLVGAVKESEEAEKEEKDADDAHQAGGQSLKERACGAMVSGCSARGLLACARQYLRSFLVLPLRVVARRLFDTNPDGRYKGHWVVATEQPAKTRDVLMHDGELFAQFHGLGRAGTPSAVDFAAAAIAEQLLRVLLLTCGSGPFQPVALLLLSLLSLGVLLRYQPHADALVQAASFLCRFLEVMTFFALTVASGSAAALAGAASFAVHANLVLVYVLGVHMLLDVCVTLRNVGCPRLGTLKAESRRRQAQAGQEALREKAEEMRLAAEAAAAAEKAAAAAEQATRQAAEAAAAATAAAREEEARMQAAVASAVARTQEAAAEQMAAEVLEREKAQQKLDEAQGRLRQLEAERDAFEAAAKAAAADRTAKAATAKKTRRASIDASLAVATVSGTAASQRPLHLEVDDDVEAAAAGGAPARTPPTTKPEPAPAVAAAASLAAAPTAVLAAATTSSTDVGAASQKTPTESMMTSITEQIGQVSARLSSTFQGVRSAPQGAIGAVSEREEETEQAERAPPTLDA